MHVWLSRLLKPTATPDPEWWRLDWPRPDDPRVLTDTQIAAACDMQVPWALSEYARRVLNPQPLPVVLAPEPLPAPVQVRCPECMSIESVPVVNIKSYSISHDGKVIEDVIGYRAACQRCACIYSIGPAGIFRHHARSSPLTPEARPPRGGDDDEAPDPNGIVPPQYQRPIPKEKPRV